MMKMKFLGQKMTKMAIFGQKMLKMTFLGQKMTFCMDEGAKCRLCLISDSSRGKMSSFLAPKMSKMAIFWPKTTKMTFWGKKCHFFKDEGAKCCLCLIYDGNRGKMSSLFAPKMSKMAIFGQKTPKMTFLGQTMTFFEG